MSLHGNPAPNSSHSEPCLPLKQTGGRHHLLTYTAYKFDSWSHMFKESHGIPTMMQKLLNTIEFF